MSEGIYAQYRRAWDAVANPAFDSAADHGHRYASLQATLKVVKEACHECGLSYVQTLQWVEGQPLLQSQVWSEDGQVLHLSSYPVALVPNPRDCGSAITYAKRYVAQCDWGIAGEEDDDGQAAERAVEQAPAEPLQDRKERMQIKLRDLLHALEEHGYPVVKADAWMQENVGCDEPNDMNEEQLEKAGRWASATLSQVVANGKERF